MKEFTTEELQVELDRRKKRRPYPMVNPNLTKLKKLCDEYIDAVINGKSVDSDYDHFIYEAAIQAIYGENIFDWIIANER